MFPPAKAPARRGRPRKSPATPPRATYSLPEGNEFPASGAGGDPFAGLVLNDEPAPLSAPPAEKLAPPALAYRDDTAGVWLYHGNCLALLDALNARYPEGCFDAIFADPPYFLSNGGITCHAGRMVRVDKGQWDKSRGPELNHEFNRAWLERCQRALKPNGTLWVTGTHHVIFSIGYAMQQLGFKILNDIAWEKPNPPPNLSCRYFTHSTETVLWAAKNEKSKHVFNYKAMRELAGGKQMKTVWKISAPRNGEKTFGKHPTQKPLTLIERCLLACTHPGDLVLDPFMGGGTTVVAALQTGRKCVGMEQEWNYLLLAAKRLWAPFDGVFAVLPILVRTRVSIFKQIDLDLLANLIDPIGAMANEPPRVGIERVFHETKLVFLSCAQVNEAQVIHTVIDASIDGAWERAPSDVRRETSHIVRCETEILRIKSS